ncbi:hypothetical protein KR026_011789 [Drosophila bipectinata]|nr:hypothetical protein KR026_011789 [Drosophila bipectinata]
MDEDIEIMQLDNVECEVCGEKTFQQREGYYYCIECGTQKQHIRAVDLTAEDNFNETVARKTIRQPKDESKAKDVDITSWEFYNYVLRGFLQELLNMGAKPELKLMTLQVWAAYMGRMEVAFCNKNALGLPKLNVRVLHRDALIIYNRKRAKRISARRNSAHGPIDDLSKKRLWNKTKRKLDASGYTKTTKQEESLGKQSIGLQWSVSARKSLKKQMPLKHLDKHSQDGSSSMMCHGLRPKVKTLRFFDRNIYSLNLTKLYIVLAIALNMVEDDIQLSDLIRFIKEEHLSSRGILTYLPDNLASKGNAWIKEMEFGNNKDKCTYKFLRNHICYVSRFVDLSPFQTPNLVGLAERYILELGLPPRLANYVGSLIKLYPPSFKTPMSSYTYPRFEARVMAYILYVMKLLFGLDDDKEIKISESAADVNRIIRKKEIGAPLLFVFTEWMEFVELRKVFISRYNQSFARRFKETKTLSGQVDEILSKERKQKEQDYSFEGLPKNPALQRQYENMTLMVEKLLKECFGETSAESIKKEHIEFQPTLTPAHSYFQRILLEDSRTEGATSGIQIPDCMRVNHSERNLDAFILETDDLSRILSEEGYKLNVEELPCQEEFHNVGIFYPLHLYQPKKQEFRANFDIKMGTYLDEINKKEKRPDFKFRLAIGTYGPAYLARKQLSHSERLNRGRENNPYVLMDEAPRYLLKINNDKVLLDSLSSLQTFREESMDPLNVPLDQPRRHLDAESVSGSEHKTMPSETEDDDQSPEEVLLNVSNFDIWLLHGFMNQIRESDKRQVRQLFPYSFRWLLEYCASTIDVNWEVLYEQLVILEVMLHHSIKDWSEYKRVLRIDYESSNKDMATLSRIYKEFW